MNNFNLKSLKVLLYRCDHVLFSQPDIKLFSHADDLDLEPPKVVSPKKVNANVNVKAKAASKVLILPFDCTYCGIPFSTESYLNRHIRKFHKNMPAPPPIASRQRQPCPLCKKIIAGNKNLKRHLRIHSGEKPYYCTKCDLGFSDSSSLKCHLKSIRHTLGSKSVRHETYVCEVCELNFPGQAEVEEHVVDVHGDELEKIKHIATTNEKSKPKQVWKMNSVNGNETHTKSVCLYCRKLLWTANMADHVLVHTGQRPYKCSLCPKHFNSLSNRNRHMRKVHGAKRLKSPPKLKTTEEMRGRKLLRCGGGTDDEANASGVPVPVLRKQRRSNLPKLKRASTVKTKKYHNCPNPKPNDKKCLKIFKTARALASHTKFVHSTVYPCQYEKCKKKFFQREKLIEHMFAHQRIEMELQTAQFPLAYRNFGEVEDVILSQVCKNESQDEDFCSQEELFKVKSEDADENCTNFDDQNNSVPPALSNFYVLEFNTEELEEAESDSAVQDPFCDPLSTD